MTEKIQQLNKIISESNNIVFFGGAGVSTESGIPDFRSDEGLKKYNPEVMLSYSYFRNNGKEFFKFYKENMLTKAEPNDTHFKLTELEKSGKLKAVITQNIDGLHQMAGTKNVLELHGTTHKNYCVKCKKIYDIDFMINLEGVPKCECGGIVRPSIVLYEEYLDDEIQRKAIKYISEADTLIVGGTSLIVYPAAGMIKSFFGRNLIIINKTNTEQDSNADLVIQESIGKVMKQIKL